MLSIIIPTRNEEKYLPRLLDSIKSQNFSDYEIIVADNGSTDSTVEIIKKFGARLVIDSKVQHPSYPRNVGAAMALGDTLLFLDADSVLPQGFLSSAYSEFKRRELKGAGFFVRFNPNKWYYNIYSFISNFLCVCRQFSKHPAVIGAGIMADREINEKIKGFDLEILLAEDYDYGARLSRQGKFRMIRSTKLLYSSRRMEQEGFWRSGYKWFKMGLFTLTNRRIKKQIVKYDFGKF
jgi:glycosyltransferase involved in cell wall biosynthesis